MKAIGFAYGKLYRCRYAAYTVVIAAPDRKTARETFSFWLKDRGHPAPSEDRFLIKTAKTVGQAPLLWAQVDVAAS